MNLRTLFPAPRVTGPLDAEQQLQVERRIAHLLWGVGGVAAKEQQLSEQVIDRLLFYRWYVRQGFTSGRTR